MAFSDGLLSGVQTFQRSQQLAEQRRVNNARIKALTHRADLADQEVELQSRTRAARSLGSQFTDIRDRVRAGIDQSTFTGNVSSETNRRAVVSGELKPVITGAIQSGLINQALQSRDGVPKGTAPRIDGYSVDPETGNMTFQVAHLDKDGKVISKGVATADGTSGGGDKPLVFTPDQVVGFLKGTFSGYSKTFRDQQDARRGVTRQGDAQRNAISQIAAADAASYLAGPDGNVKGLSEPGNIDLGSRPVVQNADGSVSTVRSMSFEEDGKEILVPTVSPDGKILSAQDAIDLYHETGQFLGKFDSATDANSYARNLHNAQARFYVAGAPPNVASAPPNVASAPPGAAQQQQQQEQPEDPSEDVQTFSLGFDAASTDALQRAGGDPDKARQLLDEADAAPLPTPSDKVPAQPAPAPAPAPALTPPKKDAPVPQEDLQQTSQIQVDTQSGEVHAPEGASPQVQGTVDLINKTPEPSADQAAKDVAIVEKESNRSRVIPRGLRPRYARIIAGLVRAGAMDPAVGSASMLSIFSAGTFTPPKQYQSGDRLSTVGADGKLINTVDVSGGVGDQRHADALAVDQYNAQTSRIQANAQAAGVQLNRDKYNDLKATGARLAKGKLTKTEYANLRAKQMANIKAALDLNKRSVEDAAKSLPGGLEQNQALVDKFNSVVRGSPEVQKGILDIADAGVQTKLFQNYARLQDEESFENHFAFFGYNVDDFTSSVAPALMMTLAGYDDPDDFQDDVLDPLRGSLASLGRKISKGERADVGVTVGKYLASGDFTPRDIPKIVRGAEALLQKPGAKVANLSEAMAVYANRRRNEATTASLPGAPTPDDPKALSDEIRKQLTANQRQ